MDMGTDTRAAEANVTAGMLGTRSRVERNLAVLSYLPLASYKSSYQNPHFINERHAASSMENFCFVYPAKFLNIVIKKKKSINTLISTCTDNECIVSGFLFSVERKEERKQGKKSFSEE